MKGKESERRSFAVKVIAVVFALAVLGAGFYAGVKTVYAALVVDVKITPSGASAEAGVIRAKFSAPVTPVTPGKIECFVIKPEVKGRYSMEGKDTVIFTPDKSFMPGASYEVIMDTSLFKAEGKKLTGGRKVAFKTAAFKVTEARHFFIKESDGKTDKELVFELSFNYPVDASLLGRELSVRRIMKESAESASSDESGIGFSIEKTNDPKRFYIKVRDVKKEDSYKIVVLRISDSLKCSGCTQGMRYAYTKRVNIGARQRLELKDVTPWPSEGTDAVALRFNMPVDVSSAEGKIDLGMRWGSSEKTEFKMRAEYNYLILEGNFRNYQNYRINIGAGLKSVSGEPMRSQESRDFYYRGLEPRVTFAEPGEILMPGGDMIIPVNVLNEESINVTVTKIFKNNIVHYLQNPSNFHSQGKVLFSANHNVENYALNREVTEYISLKKFTDDPYKGIYALTVRGGSRHWNSGQKTVMATDIALLAKEFEGMLLVKAFSIKKMKPAPGVSLELVSDNNQVMQKGVTDRSGNVTFRNFRKNSYGFRPYIITAEDKDDFSFLALNNSMLNTQVFDTSGVPDTNEGITAFVSTDRGLYRPGEKGVITAVVRNSNMTVPPGISVTLKIKGPQGESVYSSSAKLEKQGIAVFEPAFSRSALTGSYSAELSINDKKAGEVSFKVEEFMPDKLEVKIESDRDMFEPGERVSFRVKALQLFGAPAAGNRLEARVVFDSYAFSSAAHKGYSFSDPDRKYQRREERLGSENLDEKGNYEYSFDLPQDINPPSALQAHVFAEVFDDGGRPVGGFKELIIYPYDTYIGVMTDGGKKTFREKEPVKISLAAVKPSGAAASLKNVRMSIKKRVWLNAYRYGYGYGGGYASHDHREDVAEEFINIEDGKAEYVFTPKEAGEYYIYAGEEEGMRAGLSVMVTGSGAAGFDLEKQGRLEITTDKKKYPASGVINAVVSAPFDGMLYLTVERGGVYREYTSVIKSGTASVKIKAGEDFFPNVYISAIAVREQDEKGLGLPVVAFGVANVEISAGKKDIKPEITCEDSTDSTAGINVRVKTAPGAAVMLYAVDEGILQIVRYQTPDPLGHFYAKRALGVITYTTLSKILTNVAAKKQAIGGDFAEPQRKHLNPVTAKLAEPYAKYSGVLYAAKDGTVSYRFGTENFNGKARVMAVAVEGENFGSAAKSVNVADKIVLNPFLPRFLAPGDSFVSAVRVYNNTGTDGEFTVKLKTTGPVTMEAGSYTVKIESKGEARLYFKGKALEDSAAASFEYNASGNDAVSAVKREIAVRPARHTETRIFKGKLDPGASVEKHFSKDFDPVLRIVRVSVSHSRFSEYAGALEYLIRYPYGCVEQTTSSTFPMVFFKDLGLQNSSISHAVANTDAFVAAGVKRLSTFLTPSKRLSYWPGGDYEAPQYIHMYVAHMLIEAKNRGFYTDAELFEHVMKSAGISGKETGDVIKGRFTRRGNDDYYYGRREDSAIYRLFLKSLAGTPDRDALENIEKLLAVYYDSKKELTEKLRSSGLQGKDVDAIKKRGSAIAEAEAGKFLSDLSEAEKYLLSLALSLSGKKPAAKLLLEDTFSTKYSEREMWGWFNSVNKSLGMYLYAAAEADAQLSPRVAEAEKQLTKKLEGNGSFGNTQESCWALMGLAACARISKSDGVINAEFLTDGKTADKLEKSTGKTWTDTKAQWGKAAVKNTGAMPFYYNMSVEGIPSGAKKGSVSNGMKISRVIRDENGAELDLSNVKQGTLGVVTVTLEPFRENYNNIIIVDLLPAGFEIENPRLNSRGNLNFEAPSDMAAGYQDIRDDRILIFTKEVPSTASFSYTVRAVTPGDYTVPNVFGEAMYDPEINAEGFEGRRLIIKPADR